MRHQQPSLWETFFAEEVAQLWEPWMQIVDELLEDDQLLDIVYEAQGERLSMFRNRENAQFRLTANPISCESLAFA